MGAAKLLRVRRALLPGAVLTALWLFHWVANAAGPRFVTGSTFWAAQTGVPIAFRINNPLYYTDPGALSASVTHAQADAMVAAAAAPWNIPGASLTLAQGGALAEHVSASSITFGRGQLQFPADVDSSNYLAKPIAVVYDTDGSVTDLLLGVGASNPTGCRQSGVTESVDLFGPDGTIEHALLIVNGRCATDAGPSLLQLQYQMERAFGRVLGLAWSQLNDNIFSGASTPTAAQVSNWPIMHPLDVICGTYTYQCITSPFSLRSDDRSALMQLYPVTSANQTAGKVLSSSNTFAVRAALNFPTGQGMDMVNVTVRRQPIGLSEIEPYEVTSGVSGILYQQAFAQAITGAVAAGGDSGTGYLPAQAQVNMQYIEVGSGATLYMTTEAINPLYTAEYAVGPYVHPPVAPSGSVQNFVNYFARPGGGQGYNINIADAAASCSPGNDGMESSPVQADASGWWNGLLCSVGHTAWSSVAVKGGRSWTVEIDALDESGALTLHKAQPLLGIWKGTDPTGTLPTVAYTGASMNALAPGVTQIRMPVTASDASFRVAVADQFGGGRPDFLYRARILAADSLAPSILASGGGQITIGGRGFNPGMQVLVNGAAATVLSSTATQIVARVPSMALVHGTIGTALPVSVTDPATGGTSTMIGALRYSSVVLNSLVAVSAPASLKTGTTASTAFAVKVLASDGVTPVSGASVQFVVTTGSAVLAACGSAGSCTVLSGSDGIAQTLVTGAAAGAVVVSATELSGGSVVTASMADTDPMRSVTLGPTAATVVAGTAASWNLTLSAVQDGTAAAGVPVVWSAGAGLTLPTASATTSGTGQAAATVRTDGLAAGSVVTVTGCVWGTVCASWQVTARAPVRSVSLSPAATFVFAQTAANWALTLSAVQDGAAAAGVGVTWTATGGLTLQRTMNSTDGTGGASEGVSTAGLPLGSIATVTGCAWASVCASWQVTVVDAGRTVVIANPPPFVAAGASMSWQVALTAVQQGQAASGANVTWSSTGGVVVQNAANSTGSAGLALATVSTAGLTSGSTATVTACAWTSACTSWQITAVDPSQWSVTVVSGAGQSVPVSSAFTAVTLAVTDGAGHPVQAAPVTLYQTVDGWEGVCGQQGRCASAPLLASSKTTPSTDVNGQMTLTPLRVPDLPQVVNVAIVTGTTGFMTLSLPVTP